MAVKTEKPLLVGLSGTSLTNGYLASPPETWPIMLARTMRASPNCKGEIRFINMGKGSQQSSWGVSQAAIFAPLKFDVVVKEDFAINDIVALPAPLSLAQATTNFTDEVALYRANNAAVRVIHQTMSSVGAAQAVSRADLADFYANGLASAAALDCESLDHYANWPKPLPTDQTNNGDDLHPLWSAFLLYSFPLLSAKMEEVMQDFWP